MWFSLSIFHTTYTALALGFVISEILVETIVEGNGRGLVRCGGLLSERLSGMGGNCEGLQSR